MAALRVCSSLFANGYHYISLLTMYGHRLHD